MSEPLDVSLRVRLAYEAGAAAKTAAADIGAIQAAAVKLGGGLGSDRFQQDLGKLAGIADRASHAVGALEAVAARLDRLQAGRLAAELGATGGGTRLATDLHGVTAEASAATRALADTAAAAVRLGATQARGGSAAEQLQAAIKARRAAGGFANGAELEAFLKSFQARAPAPPAPAKTASPADSSQQAATARVQRDVLDLSSAIARFGNTSLGSNLRRDFAALSALIQGGRRDILQLGTAADHLAGSTGPRALEREIDVVGRSADAARRKLERLESSAGGRVGGGHGSGGHGGGGGEFRKFERAAAMPFALERVAALATSAGGAAGLGAGYGVYQAGKFLTESTKQAIDFEAAMLGVKRSLGDVPAGSIKSLEADILRTSSATGVASVELAKMAAAAGAAGRPVAELQSFIALSARSAGALGVQPGEASDRLTRIGADFRFDQNGIEDAANAAAYLQERSGANGGGTLDFMARTGGGAKLAGMTPATVAAYGGTMQKAGMSPDAAASTFWELLGKLLAGEKAGKGYTYGLHQMREPDGLPETAHALQRVARADPSAAMLRLLEDVKTLSKERRFNVLSQIVGEENGQNLALLSEHMAELRHNLGLLQDQGARTGAVEKAFKVFDETTSGKIERMNAAVGVFATKLGERLASAAGAAADAVARFFGNLNEGTARSEHAGSIVDKVVKGFTLSAEDQKALGDPKVKADVDGRLRAEERAQDMRDEAIRTHSANRRRA